jgi:hypothetical protein
MSSWKEISRLRQDRSLVLQVLQALFDLEARFSRCSARRKFTTRWAAAGVDRASIRGRAGRRREPREGRLY